MQTREALIELGFTEDWAALSEPKPGYNLISAGLKLVANQLTNRYFQPVFLISGVASNARTVAEIQIELPLELDSLEQAKAWIAYGASSNCATGEVAAWLREGESLKHLLPWVRAHQEYENRPVCSASREWLRLAIAELRAAAAVTKPGDQCEIHFDGQLLTFKFGAHALAVPASGGEAWLQARRVAVFDLSHLPKRLEQDPVPISIWEDQLTVGSRRIPLVP